MLKKHEKNYSFIYFLFRCIFIMHVVLIKWTFVSRQYLYAITNVFEMCFSFPLYWEFSKPDQVAY